MVRCGTITAVVLLLLGPVAAMASGPGDGALASADREVLKDQIDRLETLIDRQDQRLERQGETIVELQKQVQRSDSSLEAARVDQVRELVRQVVGDSEFRESLFPDTVQVGYDDGFYIRSADEQFGLTINGLLQFRYTYYNDQKRNRSVAVRQRFSDRSGIEVERLQLRLSGHLFGEDLTYEIWTEGDSDAANTWFTYYAVANYHFADALNVQVGLMPVPFGRQYYAIADDLTMLVARGMAHCTFFLEDSIGVMVHGDLLGGKLSYAVAVTNGMTDVADAFARSDPVREMDQNPAVTARLVYAVMGDMGNDESDLDYHEDPAMDVALSFGYMNDNGDSGTPPLIYAIPDFFRDGSGGFGVTNTNGTNLTQFGADAGFKWRGLSASAEYWLRMVDISDTDLLGLAAPYFVATANDDTFHQQGLQVQVGYFLIPKKLELAARVGAVWDIGPGSEGVWEYTAGVNYYVQGHNCKLQVDVTKINELPTQNSGANFIDLNDDVTMFRAQLQVAF